MRRNKYVTVLRNVPIPTWALCYLINGEDSGLTSEDKQEVDAWVERTREGFRIDVCCPKEGEEEYFCRHPAFGLPSNVEDCDVVINKRPRHGNCGYPCCGQSRFGPVRRTALDGKVWWRIYDHAIPVDNWIGGLKFKTRKDCVVCIWQELVHGRLPFEPDDDRHDIEWLKKEGLTCRNSR